MAVSVTCVKDFTIPEAASGILWSSINWTLIDFFEAPPDSHSTGSVAGDTIQCACDGTPATANGGLQVSGELTYTGPAVNCKVTVTGGPLSTVEITDFSFQIDHPTAGNLLTILRDDITTSPQVFNFTVPASTGDLITLLGGLGSGLLVYTQNAPGVISFTLVIANQ